MLKRKSVGEVVQGVNKEFIMEYLKQNDHKFKWD